MNDELLTLSQQKRPNEMELEYSADLLQCNKSWCFKLREQ